jgi:phosphoribosylaminoimidazolecarboxamide formyltransferase/IMP cyclohydrolase
MKKRALFSVSDKTGVVEFAKRVHQLGYEIVSTGGTHTTLVNAGIPVLNVSDITGFPECLDGRLKTLHPIVHGGILAVRSNPDHMVQLEVHGIEPIDLVCINLYPFKQTILKEGVQLADAIENIDIGGPTMIRAAAKNWQDVIVVTNPDDYNEVIEAMETGTMTPEKKFSLAAKVFEHTAHYDALISDYLHKELDAQFPETLTLTYEKQQDLRYGENPHQQGVFYKEVGGLTGTLPEAEQIHGKELSYNNIGDAAAAIAIIKEFDVPCAVAVKHANPCGVGLGNTISEAFSVCYEADKVSIFGGIVALNRTCDVETAKQLKEIFLEIVIAPSFTDEAQDILVQKKNLRLLVLENIATPIGPKTLDMKKVPGGLLIQTVDQNGVEDWKTVTTAQASPDDIPALELAWKIVKHVKSNAIVLAKGNGTVGIGPGQTNRITALNIALEAAGEKAKGSVMASDAFFPFEDCVTTAAKAGVKAIVQPGGSIKDQDSIDACNANGIPMIFTGIRHFKH